MIAIGNFFFRFRNTIFPIVILWALLVASPHYSFGSLATDWVADLIGIGLIFAGQSLRVLTIGYEYIRRGGRDGRVYAEGLVQGGVFAHCRNPLYLGNILIACGFIVVIGHGGLTLIGIPAVLLVYVAIVSAEEDYLSRRFGEPYDAYRRRVNRWIPDWRGFHESTAEMRFKWQRVIVKEYNTIFAVLVGLLIVQTWTRIAEEDMTPTRLAWTLSAGGALIAGYLLVRSLKKSQRLRA